MVRLLDMTLRKFALGSLLLVSLGFVLACGGGGGGVPGGGGAAVTLGYVVVNGTSIVRLESGTSARPEVLFSPGSIRNLRLNSSGNTLLFDNGVSVSKVNTDGTGLMNFLGLRYADWNANGTKIFGVTADSKVVVVNPDGSGAQQIFDGNSGAGIQGIDVSPDGTKIGLIYGPSGWLQLQTIDPDGSNLMALTGTGTNYLSFAYSPDGSMIVAEKTVTSQSDIVVLEIAGLSETNITNSFGENEKYPVFTSNGQKIYYSATTGPSTDRELFEMNVDGSGVVALTDTIENETYSVAIP